MKSSLLEAARSSQLFPFCGQFGAASIVSTRTWSVFNCVRSSGKENQHQKHLRIMSFQKPKAVYAANHRQCTAAGGEVPVPCGGIQELRKAWQGDWRTDCQSKLSSAWAVSLCGAAKLPVSKSAFVPILTYSNECWVMTERILSQVQVAEMEFLRWLHSATFRDKVRRCEMRKTLNAEALLRAEIPATLVWPRFQKVPGKIGEAGLAGYAHRKATHSSTKDQVEWLHLRPCLVPSWCGTSRTIIAVHREVSLSLLDCFPATVRRGKAGMKMKKWDNSRKKTTVGSDSMASKGAISNILQTLGKWVWHWMGFRHFHIPF